MVPAPAIAELRSPGVLGRLGQTLAFPLLAYNEWLDKRAERRALYSMNELALADIGLTSPDLAGSQGRGASAIGR
jgi:uncharacterized protein YjiS (DUF1127 family)